MVLGFYFGFFILYDFGKLFRFVILGTFFVKVEVVVFYGVIAIRFVKCLV